MRVYSQMVGDGKDDKSTSKAPAKGPKKRGPKSVRERREAMEKVKEQKPKPAAKKTTPAIDVKQKEVEELEEEIKRLEGLIDKYEKEAKNVIKKAIEWKDKEKTSVLQTIELFRLNSFLISHLPDSERVLEQYLQSKNEHTFTQKDNNKKPTVSKPFISPVTPISNYFKPTEKLVNGSVTNSKATNSRFSNGNVSESNNRNDSSYTSSKRRSPRKCANKVYKSSDDEDEDPKKPTTGSGKENTVSKGTNSTENEKNELDKPGPKKRAPRKTNSQNADENKPKRKRRKRDEGPRGYFLCTFDPRQCDEIMDTKEHYDFHMSGHYDAKYVCPFCAYTGPTVKIIKRHVNKERELAIERAKTGKPLNEDQKAHHEIKVYTCFGCKVCDKMHKKFESRCEHIKEDDDNQCDFAHDIDYEFKDHLKMHFADAFKHVKNKDDKRQKIRVIVDKFVDEQYFENRAKTDLLVEKFKDTPLAGKSKPNEKEDKSDKQDNDKGKGKQKSNKGNKKEDDQSSSSTKDDDDRPIELPDKPKDSESDWSD